MEGARKLLLGAGLFFCFLHSGSAMRCTRENFIGQTEYFFCPDGEDPAKKYCCGTGDFRYCCSSFSPFNDDLEDLIDDLPTILGVIVAIIVGFIVVCVVCCCLCPFCLLYKRRNRGTVHNPNPDVSVMQPLQNQPQSYAPPPQGAPYPTQPAPYPTQPSYPPQPYPPQPYPPQPYPPQPYPDQPPMYTEKQPPPYNPTY